MEAAPHPAIRIRGLEKAFDGHPVLRGVDLDVAVGESLVIMGASGTGKSVLLKHIVALLRPDAGTIEIGGVPIHELDNRALTRFRRKFGVSFQEGALFDSLTVGENVAFPLTRRSPRMPAAAIRARVRECLQLVRLAGVEAKLPSQLSGGMRRRAGFARAIAHEPEILLFDEPTSGLDPVTSALIQEVICGINDRLGSTTMTISHDMHGAFRIADRIAMLHEGRIIAAAPPEQFRALADPRVRQFLEGSASGPLTAELGD